MLISLHPTVTPPDDLFEYGNPDAAASTWEQPEAWRRLDSFLQETWENRPQTEPKYQPELEPEEDNDEGKGKQRYLKTENGRLKAHRFVGTVCFEDATINIWPRVFEQRFKNAGSDATRAEQRGVMTRNMLHWASRADYLKLSPNLGGSSVPPDISNFFEAYIWLFAQFTCDLLARQPYWQYQSEIEEGEVLRGRLVMNQYINDCLARGRWHRLVYEHEPFVFDNLLNRIIKRTCQLAQGFCASPTVREKLGAILFELDEVDDVFCTARDCDRVHLNRMHTEYQIVLDNCRTILAQCQADNSGRDMKRFCFLLPMDRLFEEYLRVLAGEALPKGWTFDESQPYLVPEMNAFQLRHDLFFRSGQTCVIADAKWKSRVKKGQIWEEKAKQGNNFGVSQSDMYQMVAYAHGRGSTEVRLLYPAMGDALPSSHIATLTTKPGGISAGSSINVQIHELKIHAYPEQNLAVGEHYTEVEKAIKEAFKSMLSP